MKIPTDKPTRKKKQKIMTAADLPIFAEGYDSLPGPADIAGRRMQWVGFGWVDEGEADGTEPLKIIDNP